jgi:hypothetical protein
LNCLFEEETLMLVAAAVVLAATALGGATAAVLRIRGGSNPPIPLALVHGGAGAAGLVLLLIAGVADGFSGALTVSLVLLAVAALGGFVMFTGHLRAHLLPLPILAVHALVAVAGYVALLVAAVE